MKATEELLLTDSSNLKEESQDNSKYFEVHEVNDTPFTIIETDKGCVIVVGNQQVCLTIFEDVAKAKKYINKKPWELILVTTSIHMEAVLKTKKLLENGKEKKD